MLKLVEFGNLQDMEHFLNGGVTSGSSIVNGYGKVLGLNALTLVLGNPLIPAVVTGTVDLTTLVWAAPTSVHALTFTPIVNGAAQPLVTIPTPGPVDPGGIAAFLVVLNAAVAGVTFTINGASHLVCTHNTAGYDFTFSFAAGGAGVDLLSIVGLTPGVTAHGTSTITFSDITGVGLTPLQIKNAIETVIPSLSVNFGNYKMQIRDASGISGTVVNRAGTANPIFGFSSTSDVVGLVYGPPGSASAPCCHAVSPGVRLDSYLAFLEV